MQDRFRRISVTLFVGISLIIPTACSKVLPTGDTVGSVYPVPTSIDTTGTADVSATVNTFIRSVPDGNTIVFPRDPRYRIENTISLVNRNNLIVNGNGTTFFATTDGSGATPMGPGNAQWRWPRHRDQVAVWNGSNVVLRNLTVKESQPERRYPGELVCCCIRGAGRRGVPRLRELAPRELHHRQRVRRLRVHRPQRRRHRHPRQLHDDPERPPGHHGRRRNQHHPGPQQPLVHRPECLRPRDLRGRVVGHQHPHHEQHGWTNPSRHRRVERGKAMSATCSTPTTITSTFRCRSRDSGFVGRRHDWSIIGNTSDHTFGSPHGSIRMFQTDHILVKDKYQPLQSGRSPQQLATEFYRCTDVVETNNQFPFM